MVAKFRCDGEGEHAFGVGDWGGWQWVGRVVSAGIRDGCAGNGMEGSNMGGSKMEGGIGSVQSLAQLLDTLSAAVL
jgi:hypothetical protein